MACCQHLDCQVLSTQLPDCGKLVTHVAGERHHFLFMGDDNVFDKKAERYAKITEQSLIVHSRESEAEVTNNKRLQSTYCTVEANN